MGYSCSKAAADTLALISAACVTSTGNSNTYRVVSAGAAKKDRTYFFEQSRREYEDGAITGAIYRNLPVDADGKQKCRPAGGFRIDGDGKLSRGDKWMRNVSAEVAIDRQIVATAAAILASAVVTEVAPAPELAPVAETPVEVEDIYKNCPNCEPAPVTSVVEVAPELSVA